MASVDALLDEVEEFIDTNLKPEEWQHLPIEYFWELVLAHVVGGFIPRSREAVQAEEDENRKAFDEIKRLREADDYEAVQALIDAKRPASNWEDRADRKPSFDLALMSPEQQALVMDAFHNLVEMTDRYAEAPPNHYGVFAPERIAWEALANCQGDLALHQFTYDAASRFEPESIASFYEIAQDAVSFWLLNTRDGIMDKTNTLMRPYWDKWSGQEHPNE